MTEQKQIYKCNICGNVVEVLNAGKGELVCCGQPMELEEEKIEDEGKEKHVPIIEKNENIIKVKIGEVSHPMEEKHYIQWVEIIGEKGSSKKLLKPGDYPEAIFDFKEGSIVRIYCNIHGLWKAKII